MSASLGVIMIQIKMLHKLGSPEGDDQVRTKWAHVPREF